MLRVRPIGASDIDQALCLTAQAGPGFTGLPRDRQAIQSRVELSELSFARAIAVEEAWYTFVVEELAEDSLLGIASVKARVGLCHPHYSLRLSCADGRSTLDALQCSTASLTLVTQCNGFSEVGSLFVSPQARGRGAGKLLARARYVLIALHKELFAEVIMAELRGVFDECGRPPFWAGYAGRHAPITFAAANAMVINGEFKRLASYLPTSPVSVKHLDDEARAAIGKVHEEGQAAFRMLAYEGFDHSGLIDVLDGGPTLTCARNALKTVQELRVCEAQSHDLSATASSAILANAQLSAFALIESTATSVGDRIGIRPETMDILGVRDCEKVGVL